MSSYRSFYFSLVGHYEGELRVHGCVSNEMPILYGIPEDEFSLPMANEPAEEDPQRFLGSSLCTVPIILQNLKRMRRIFESNLPIKGQKGQFLKDPLKKDDDEYVIYSSPL